MQGFRGLGRFGTAVLEFAVAVAIGLLGGWWLDKAVGWAPWLMIAGLLFGVAAGFKTVFMSSRKMIDGTCQRDHGTGERHGDDDASG